jgi:uncharacterized membrane protein YgdD (TMEM256/DUF423 family)
MRGKRWLAIGALLAFVGVALGAFGAHGLKTSLRSGPLPPDEQTRRLENWETAARYQMYHALALVCVGIMAASQWRRVLDVAAASFCLGVVVFSGCLYTYVLTGARVWAMIVPLGGVLLLVGWLALLVGSVLPDATTARDAVGREPAKK